MFDEVACEEVYGYDDADMAVWLDELEIEWVNGLLQEIADAGRSYEVDLAWEQDLLNEFVSTELEASQVGD